MYSKFVCQTYGQTRAQSGEKMGQPPPRTDEPVPEHPAGPPPPARAVQPPPPPDPCAAARYAVRVATC